MATPPTAEHNPDQLRALLNAYDKKKADFPKEIAKPSIIALCMSIEAWCENCDLKGTLGDKCADCLSYCTVTDEQRKHYSPERRKAVEEARARCESTKAFFKQLEIDREAIKREEAILAEMRAMGM